MRFFIVAAFSVLVCTVYASPIYRDDGVELSTRGIKEFFDNIFHPKPKCKVAKGSVKDTLGHLTNHTEGPTKSIDFYDIKGGFGGQSAVLKKLTMPQSGKSAKKTGKSFVEKEISHLCAVNQLLNWGVQPGKGKSGDTYYIVTKQMGVSAAHTGLDNDSIKKLKTEALSRYHTKHHLDLQNPTPSNFVFHQKGGKWQAEVVGWEVAKADKGMKLPGVPKPQKL